MASTLSKLLDEIVRRNLIEDRSEYTVEDLQKAYNLNDQEAKNLHWMIKEEMKNPEPRTLGDIEEALNKIEPTLLGRGLQRYMEDANFEDWDAHERRDLAAYKRLLRDLILFINHGGVGE